MYKEYIFYHMMTKGPTLFRGFKLNTAVAVDCEGALVQWSKNLMIQDLILHLSPFGALMNF